MSVSLYIHIPFCAFKCPYCSFPVVIGQRARQKDYLDALEREAQHFSGQEVSSVYVGGGTPSELDEAQLSLLAGLIQRNFLVTGHERTSEINPESVDAAKIKCLAELGFNRMSMGVQTFNRGYLERLGRRHQPEHSVTVFKMLRDAGFANINVDLMFGFPGQTQQELDADIDQLLDLGSEHVSLYALTVEPRSAFGVRGEKISDDLQAVFYRRICTRLSAAGLKQYEVSNFARPGFESLHNLNYWQGGEYLGLGMGAHAHMHGERSWNTDIFPEYLQLMRKQGHAVVGREKLSPPEKMMETFLFGLRMNAGVDVGALEERFGCLLPPEKIDQIEALVGSGFLVENGSCLCVTDKGRLVLDEISARLI